MSDWGKGVINNIGWGQGANNDIGWGSIYDKSFSGDTLLGGGSGFEGILNQFPGASLGLSLDKLDKNYTGSAIKVRRSSDNNELDIGFVNNELDTASLLNFVGSGNGFVSIWYDQSGEGNNLLQTSASRQPMIVKAGVLVTENGKPALNFDGIDDSLLNTSFKLNPVPFTLFIVNKFNEAYKLQFLIDQSEGSNAGYLFRIYTNNYNYYYYPDITDVTLANSNTSQNLMSQLVADENQKFYLNSTLSASATTAINDNPIPTNDFVIGGDPDNDSRNADTFLQEIIIYKSNQESNITDIQENINNHYSIY
jgi:hypothetical protein